MTDQRPWTAPQQVMIDVGRLFFGALFQLRVEGREHLPEAGGCLVVCNHPTLVDPLLVMTAMPRQATALAEETPWRYPELAYLLELFEVIKLQRGGSPAAALARAADAIEQGKLLVVFPEGDLSRGRGVARFHPGAARLAIESGCPVVPAALCGTEAAWPYGSLLPRLSPVTLRLGAPVRFGPPATAPRGLAALRRVSEELRHRVSTLYTPWDPRRAPRP